MDAKLSELIRGLAGHKERRFVTWHSDTENREKRLEDRLRRLEKNSAQKRRYRKYSSASSGCGSPHSNGGCIDEREGYGHNPQTLGSRESIPDDDNTIPFREKGATGYQIRNGIALPVGSGAGNYCSYGGNFTDTLVTPQHFGWLNYTVFGGMLCASSIIGMYFGLFGNKQKTIEEYMLGGQTMGFFIIAISLVTSHISAVTLIGVPTEIYLNGTLYWLICPSMIVAGIVTTRIFMPVYWSLKITTVQQYLEMRFGKRLRAIGSILFGVNTMLFLPILIYGPSLSFSQVSGINLHVISTTVCIVCTFYTMLGGLKGIVWADVLQALVMLGSCITWVTIGTWNAGGGSRIWKTANEAGRLRIFEMNPNPIVARSFWTMTLGNIGLWVANSAINPVTVQRYVAVSSQRNANRAVVLYCMGMIFLNTLSTLTGLIIYAIYGDCDPVLNGAISKHDQLVPYFVMDTVGHIPGLPGLFIAAIFSGALSSLSAAMNALSGIVYDEFIVKLKGSARFSPHASVKLITMFIGLFCLLMTFVVDKMGEMVQSTLSLNGVTLGALLGIYTLGMTCPWANEKGTIIGAFASLSLLVWIGGGSLLMKINNGTRTFGLPLSTNSCLPSLDNGRPLVDTFNLSEETDDDETFILFKISFAYYTLLGSLVVIIVGGLSSWAVGPTPGLILDPRLIAPPFQFLLPKRTNIEREEELSEITLLGRTRANGITRGKPSLENVD